MKRTLSMFTATLLVVATVFVSFLYAVPADDKFERPPGTIVATSPDFQKVYVGSPSIAILPDGTYVASHDWFGDGMKPTRTLIYASKDMGKTWSKKSEILHRHWSNLFVHQNALYILGTMSGNWTIQRSDDGGATWTEPKDSKTGLLLKGRYHTAPCPMLVHHGRIWRAFEKMEPPYQWGTCFQAMMSSAPLDADLLDAESWTFSNAVPYPFDQWSGRGWLEGNAVLSPEGKVVNVIRVQIEGGDKAAILSCSDDGKTLSYDPKTAMIDFYGGAVKFTIRYDSKSKKYWTIANKQKDPPATRNVLLLASSDDLRNWEIRTVLFRHHDRIQHAWQYIDWLFEGDDNIVFVSRTGWDGSHNQHDANYLTFHRIENFRNVYRKDDPPWLGEEYSVKTETKSLSIELFGKPGSRLEIGDFDNGQKAFANRNYTWQNVPWELQGWKTVRNYGGEGTGVRATAKKDVDIAFARTPSEHAPIYEGWTKVNADRLHYTDTAQSPLIVYRKKLLKGETVMLPYLPGWAGETLIFEETPVPYLNRIKYDHPGLTVDLGVGLWAWPIPMDVNGDGFTDLVVVCEDKPYNGTYVFEHPGTSGKMPVFKKAKRISKGIVNTQVSYIDGKSRVLSPGNEYPDFRNTGLEKPVKLPLPANVHPNKLRGNMWKYVDYDGDGKLDLLIGIDDWTDYGWDNAYDEKGNWTRGPLRGHLYVAKNIGTNESPVYEKPFMPVDTEGNKLETFGWPCPNMLDWDGDGDLDIICGEFLDGFTYFENVGTRTKPKYAKGVKLTLEDGSPLAMDLEMITPVAFDWTGDGHYDLICGDEDGRVALIENTGKLKDGRPVFLAPKYFQQESDEVKCGALSTPCGVDWDGDGDWDIICGNTAGYIVFYENLSGPGVDPPKWAAPKYLETDGKPIRFMAGPNGSIQGPCEAKWGYTVLTVADWSGDGLPDIMVNTIWGRVVWFENIGTKTSPKLAAAKPVEVEWDGPPPTLAYGWLRPNGKELLTQWRTTPCMFDLNGDGLMDLLMLDHEGYFCFFERKKVDGRLVLLPPKRVMLDENGKPLRLNDKIAGGSGRRKICMVDYDGDGKTDFLLNSINADFYRQIKAENGAWYFKSMGPIDRRNISSHSTNPTFVDFDGNGIPDPLVGAEDGYMYYKKNPRSVETKTP